MVYAEKVFRTGQFEATFDLLSYKLLCLVLAMSRSSRAPRRRGGAQGNGNSQRPSISADGRFVAFDSAATNLIPGGDANGAIGDVFVFDRTTGSLELVSRQAAADGGAQGNFGSFRPSISAISADERFVAFDSEATNLIPGGGLDANGTGFNGSDVFVRSLEAPKPKAMPWLLLLLDD